MTSETLVRSQLTTALPPLLEQATVVVLTPASADMAWAADTAWSIARAVARHGRRVALVDLSLKQRALEPREPATEAAEGIVDAFCFDASLQRVVQKGDVPGLFFIGVGSEPSESVDIWGHQRWDRIARGFAEENALLLLFVPPEAWTRLRPSPDRVVTLGTMDDARISSESARWSGEGVPVTHLIPDPPEPEIPDAPVALWSSHIAKHRRSRSRLRRVVAVAVGVGALAAAGYLLTRSAQRSAPSVEDATPDTATTQHPTTAPVMPQPTAAPPPAPPVVADDSLYYSVQVASFKTRARALDHAAAYESQGWPTTLTPVQLGLQGVWYRVMVGVFASPADAEAALRGFYATGLLERPNGTILRTPHVLTVSTHPDGLEAAAAAAGLREAEIPAYIVESSSAHRVVVGAFENPEQAALMDSILANAGLSATLTSREGRRS